MSSDIYFDYHRTDNGLYLEATDTENISNNDMINHAKDKGFYLSEIGIWYDTLQGFFRGNAKCTKIEDTNV